LRDWRHRQENCQADRPIFPDLHGAKSVGAPAKPATRVQATLSVKPTLADSGRPNSLDYRPRKAGGYLSRNAATPS